MLILSDTYTFIPASNNAGANTLAIPCIWGITDWICPQSLIASFSLIDISWAIAIFAILGTILPILASSKHKILFEIRRKEWFVIYWLFSIGLFAVILWKVREIIPPLKMVTETLWMDRLAWELSGLLLFVAGMVLIPVVSLRKISIKWILRDDIRTIRDTVLLNSLGDNAYSEEIYGAFLKLITDARKESIDCEELREIFWIMKGGPHLDEILKSRSMLMLISMDYCLAEEKIEDDYFYLELIFRWLKKWSPLIKELIEGINETWMSDSQNIYGRKNEANVLIIWMQISAICVLTKKEYSFFSYKVSVNLINSIEFRDNYFELWCILTRYRFPAILLDWQLNFWLDTNRVLSEVFSREDDQEKLKELISKSMRSMEIWFRALPPKERKIAYRAWIRMLKSLRKTIIRIKDNYSEENKRGLTMEIEYLIEKWDTEK